MAHPSLNQLPWPNVHECHGHPGGLPCSQCDGSHTHRWAAWPPAPPENPDALDVRAVRCVTCGARKCDVDLCLERRHHLGPHLLVTGEIRQVGA